MNPIAKRIQEARLKAKMSEKELAKKCGLAASYIMQIESGKKIINENTADVILAVFGESMESSYTAYLEEEEKKPVPAKSPVKPQAAPKTAVSPEKPVQVEPNAQWAGALANIIKQYQILDVQSGKAVGQKELPVLNRKIEEVPWDKLLFFSASDDDAAGLRIRKGDVLWIQETAEFQKEGVYLIQRQNRRQIHRLQRQGAQFLLSQAAGGKPIAADAREVKIIGRCVKVEFIL